MRQAGYLGLLLFAFVLPWEDAVRLPVLGSAGRAAGLVLLGLGLPALISEGRLRLRWPSLFLATLCLFVFWSAASLLWSFDPASTTAHVFSRLQLLVMLLLAWQLLETPEKARPVMAAYLLGCGVAVGTALFNFAMGNEFVYQRYSAIGTDPNDFATLVALGVPLAWFLLLRGPKNILGWLPLLYFPLVPLTLLLTSSRGGSVVSALALLVVPLTFRLLRRSQRRFLWGVGIAAAAGAIYAAPAIADVAGTSLARLSTTAGEVSAGTLNERSDLWLAGVTLFGDAGPLGVGAGAFENAIVPYAGLPKVAHNTYISVLVELGPVGLLLFLGCFATAALPLLRLGADTKVPLLILLLTLAVGLLPLTWEVRKTTYFIMLLATSQGTALLAPGRLRRLSPAAAAGSVA